TPNAGFVGDDRFYYAVHDGRLGRALGLITVHVVNHPPVAVADKATTHAGVAVTLSVLANDSDADHDPLPVAGFTQPANGKVIKNGDRLVFMPTSGFTGSAAFSYTVSDPYGAHATATATVSVTNTAPIARADQANARPGREVGIDVLSNDSDP